MKCSFSLILMLIYFTTRLQAVHHYLNLYNETALHCDMNDTLLTPLDFIAQYPSTDPYSISLSNTKVSTGQNITVLISATSSHHPSDFFMKVVSADDGNDPHAIQSSSPVGKFYMENISRSFATLLCHSRILEKGETTTPPYTPEPWEIRTLWEAPSFPGTFVIIMAVMEESSRGRTTMKSQTITVETLQHTSNSESSAYVSDETTRECGLHQNCIASPNGCFYSNGTQNEACDIFLSFYPEYVLVHFELMSRGQGYAAMGISDDGFMGNDIVIECLIPDEGLPKIYASINYARSNMKIGIDKEYLIYKNFTIEGDVLRCSFSLPMILSVGPITANLKNKKYYILLASGPSRNNDIGFHNNRMVSVVEVNLTSDNFIIINSGDSSTPIAIVIHGVIMIVCWIGMVSISIFIARFYKDMWPKKTLCGLKLWFVCHRALNVTSVILTIIAIVLLMLYTGITDVWQAHAHPSFGIITTILAISQPIGAIFRPPPDHRNRPLFNWVHYGIGMTAFMLSVVTVYLAVELKASHLKPYFYWILSAYVVFFIAMYGIVEFYAHIRNQQESLKREMESSGQVVMQNELSLKHESTTSFKSLMLLITVMGIFAFTLTMSLVVAL